jgi:hypothetical protein
MPSSPDNADGIDQQQLSRYIQSLQDRYPAYTRAHREDIKHDAISRMIIGYLFTGSRAHFEAELQGIMTDAERRLLSFDATFTRAWQIFAELCWLKRKFSRLAILLGIIVTLLGLAFFSLWAAPYVIGPQAR